MNLRRKQPLVFGEGFGRHVHYYVNGVCRCGKGDIQDSANGKQPR